MSDVSITAFYFYDVKNDVGSPEAVLNVYVTFDCINQT